MSDNIVTLNNQNRGVGDNRDQEPNARLKWIADLVCAILAPSHQPRVDCRAGLTAIAQAMEEALAEAQNHGWLAS